MVEFKKEKKKKTRTLIKLCLMPKWIFAFPCRYRLTAFCYESMLWGSYPNPVVASVWVNIDPIRFVMLEWCFTARWLQRFGKNNWKFKALIHECSLGIGFWRSWHFRCIMKPSCLICTGLFCNLPPIQRRPSCSAAQCTCCLHCSRSLEETLSEWVLELK